MKIQSFKCLNKEQINKIESQLDVNLPTEYKTFLEQIGGGVVEKDDSNRITISEINEDIVLDVLYGEDEENEKASITFWMKQFEGELLEDAVIIGDDLLQGFLIMICEGENQGIYYWDDSYNFESSDDESNMYGIADSFGELIKQLKS